jgi:hypothetical protein
MYFWGKTSGHMFVLQARNAVYALAANTTI